MISHLMTGPTSHSFSVIFSYISPWVTIQNQTQGLFTSGLIFLGSLCSPRGDGLLLWDGQDHAGCSETALAGAHWLQDQRRPVSQSEANPWKHLPGAPGARLTCFSWCLLAWQTSLLHCGCHTPLKAFSFPLLKGEQLKFPAFIFYVKIGFP